MKLVAYTRVSTRTQVEEGLGLELQEQAIKAWAKTNHHRIVEWASDEGVSGTKDLSDRFGLADALNAVKERRAGAVVFYRLDRLARELIVQESVLVDIWRSGGEAFSTVTAEANLRDDPDDPGRKLVRQMLGAFNEYERAMIALRLRNGRRRKAIKGGFAYGAPGFGYRAEDKALVPVETEQAVLARIAELRASGASLRAICATLEAEGHHTKRGGTTWHPPVVARIVTRLEASAA